MTVNFMLVIQPQHLYAACTWFESSSFFQYNEYDLYTQLSFFQHIFDLSRVTDKRE
jgi:hypothetical protein